MINSYKPGPPLRSFVDCFWHSEGYAPKHDRERLLPTGTVNLAINLRQDRIRVFESETEKSAHEFTGAVVSGTYSRCFVLETSQQASVVGVHFRPGGAAPFLGLPVRELTDQHVALADVWGDFAHELRERLLEATSLSALFAILEQSLLRRLTELPSGYPAVVGALKHFRASPTVARVRDVSAATGCSAKRFIRLFHSIVGLTPKVFCRILRFQAVLDRLVQTPPVEWTTVALEGGYFDQSHLIRDFRAFAAITPLEYQPIGPDRKNHVVLSDPSPRLG